MFGWFKKDPIRPEMVETVREFLGSDGIEYFTKIFEENGTLMTVVMHGEYPHATHFREGMQIRNFLRSTGLCVGWDAHDYDNRWEDVTLRACGYKNA